MKFAKTPIALLVALASPVSAMTAETQLQHSVELGLKTLGSRIELPMLASNDLAALKDILKDSEESKAGKIRKVEFYLSMTE